MRVLQSFRTGDGTTNPYLVQLVTHLGPDPEVLGFSWRSALTERYDVFHAHWPDALLQGPTAAQRMVRRMLFRLLLLRFRFLRNRIAVVRTIHTQPGHETTKHTERELMERFDRQTTLWIRLTPATQVHRDAPVVTIEHGDYRGWFDTTQLTRCVPGRFVYFGVVRPSKGVPDLIRAFTALRTGPDGDAVSARVVGSPTTIDVGAEVLLAAQADDRVVVTLGHISDSELAAEVSQAELITLPYLQVHDLGAAVLALSLNRPVLVPSTPATEALRTEVGRGWVFTYDGAVTASVLGQALSWCRDERSRRPRSLPDLRARSWPNVASKHREAYATALSLVRTFTPPAIPGDLRPVADPAPGVPTVPQADA